MLDFSSLINLPLTFLIIIAFAIFMYVFLDGFDLGIGILFPLAPSHDCRHKMMNSIAPFWDGNETWLVLGGGALFAAFPLAYSIILPAFYIPIILMLLGLIFRGVAFEFRFKSHSDFERKIWDFSFCFGSIIATFFQGVMLGAFIEGNFGVNWFDEFSCLTGIALIAGYSLLGSSWLIMKTDGKTQEWARKMAFYFLMLVVIFVLIVSVWTPFLNVKIFARWFENIFYLAPIPIVTFITFIFLALSLKKQKEKLPFFLTLIIFFLCYLGFAISLFPYIVPYKISFAQAAAASTSLSLILIGVAITIPMILLYTAYSYFVFRGKAKSDSLY